MESSRSRIVDHLIAFVAVLFVIAFAPVITLVGAVYMAFLNLDLSESKDGITLFLMAGPVLCAFWYMFIASMTRCARGKKEGISTRTGFLWAGGRLFGGYFLSLASTASFAYVACQLAPKSIVVFPALFFGVWTPVVVNLIRHFMRRYDLVTLEGNSKHLARA